MARLPFGNEAVRIIPRLNHPRAPAFVPGDPNRLDHLRLSDEELQIKISGDLRIFDALLRFERKLKMHRLWAAFVIRDFSRLASQWRARGEKIFPRGPGLFADAI